MITDQLKGDYNFKVLGLSPVRLELSQVGTQIINKLQSENYLPAVNL